MTDQPVSPLAGDFVARPTEVLAGYRESCPVAKVVAPNGRARWLITREEDVRAAFLDPRLSLRSEPRDPGRPHRALDMSLVNYDPPDHTRIRRLAAPAFAPGRIAGYRERVAAAAGDLLEALGEPERFELMAEFAEPFSFHVLCEVLAVPGGDRAALHAAVRVLVNQRRHDAAALESAVDHLDAFVRTEIAARLGGAGQDVFSTVVRAWEAAEGSVTEAELVDLLAMLLLAGFDSTVQMLGMCVLALLGEDGPTARLAAEPGLLARALDELLRWDTPGPFSTTRVALEEVRIGGSVIPAGGRVLLAVAAANRDPRCHPDPDRLDLERPDAARHLTFGLGPHYCLGAALARLELTEALGALLTRWPGLQLDGPADGLSWSGGHQHRRLDALPLRPGPPGAGRTRNGRTGNGRTVGVSR
ncbi:cytochrome P450 [Kitasatospora sp. NPDC008050]|uniref:cytochrome P450 n=1 Tax=Kitasatospora sp. NPDC008050 TaxID=3364021 RepID=UPI0036E91B56